MRVAFTGSRDLETEEYRDKIATILVSLYLLNDSPKENITIIHGACGLDKQLKGKLKGIDKLVDEEAAKLNLKVERYPADWSLGLPAGPLRNKEMIESGIDCLFVFPGGKGTKNMKKQALKANIQVEEIK